MLLMPKILRRVNQNLAIFHSHILYEVGIISLPVLLYLKKHAAVLKQLIYFTLVCKWTLYTFLPYNFGSLSQLSQNILLYCKNRLFISSFKFHFSFWFTTVILKLWAVTPWLLGLPWLPVSCGFCRNYSGELQNPCKKSSLSTMYKIVAMMGSLAQRPSR